MKMVRIILLSLATIAMFINFATAANYTVGGPNGGWNQATDVQNWASSQSFLSGDYLIFEYTLNHDVTEVSRADFDSCTASNPLQPPHSGGRTVIPLTSSGTRYFICGTGGHCLSGMKVEIDTAAAPTPPPPAAIPPPSVQPPPPSTPSIPPKSSVSPPVSTPPVKNMAPPPSPKHSYSPAPKVSPSSSPSRASPPAAALSPSGSLMSPPPSPSSANRFSVMGTVTACSGFLMMMILNL